MAGTAAEPTIQERLGWRATPEQHERIRRLWISHSIAEKRRDLDGLVATLAEDCVYELVPLGRRWEGHAGARAFYSELLGAFPDLDFALTDIVIGPQGVFEVADATGTHLGEWNGLPPTGQPVRFAVLILFPWNPAAGKFGGEKVWFDPALLPGG